MKSLFKSKKFVAGLAVCLIVIAVIAVVAVVKQNKLNTDEPTTEPSTSETTEVIITPDITIEDETGSTTAMVTDKDTITPDERIALPTQAEKETTKGSDTAPKPATPVTTQSGGNDSGGIVIIGNDDVHEYSCGVKGHHCESAETHSFIVSLEKKGCPMCGSHSCKSFYSVDEWGNACYDITQCPEYSVKKDPCEYCQTCGKKVGNGDNGTCVRFTVDTTCPICGKTVKAKTCHTH